MISQLNSQIDILERARRLTHHNMGDFGQHLEFIDPEYDTLYRQVDRLLESSQSLLNELDDMIWGMYGLFQTYQEQADLEPGEA